jgi:hypothetical protein
VSNIKISLIFEMMEVRIRNLNLRRFFVRKLINGKQFSAERPGASFLMQMWLKCRGQRQGQMQLFWVLLVMLGKGLFLLGIPLAIGAQCSKGFHGLILNPSLIRWISR